VLPPLLLPAPALKGGKHGVRGARRLEAGEGETGARGLAAHPDAQLVPAGRERVDVGGLPAVQLAAACRIGDDDLLRAADPLEAADDVANEGDIPVVIAGGELHQYAPTLSASASPSPRSARSSAVERTVARVSALEMVAPLATSIQ